MMNKLALAGFVLSTIICGFFTELCLNSHNYPNVISVATNIINGYIYIWNPYISSLCVIVCLISILKLIFDVLALESENSTQRSELERYTRLLQEYDVANQQLYNSLWQTRHVATDLRTMIENLQFEIARLNTEIDSLESEVNHQHQQEEQQQQPQREIHVVLIWEENE